MQVARGAREVVIIPEDLYEGCTYVGSVQTTKEAKDYFTSMGIKHTNLVSEYYITFFYSDAHEVVIREHFGDLNLYCRTAMIH